MATLLDLGLLRNFVDIFAWLLVFLIVYGALEITNILKNRGLHALFAFVITAAIVLTGGGVNLIVAMAPWVVVLVALIFFILLLTSFAGGPEAIKDMPAIFGTKGVIWTVSIPLFVILTIAWTQGSQEETLIDIDPDTGEVITTDVVNSQAQRPFVVVLTDPKILRMFLIMRSE